MTDVPALRSEKRRNQQRSGWTDGRRRQIISSEETLMRRLGMTAGPRSASSAVGSVVSTRTLFIR